MDNLAEVIEMLKVPLDADNPQLLMQQLAEVEGWQGVVSHDYRHAQNVLAVMRNRYLMPKGQGLTELDRQTQLDATCADYEEARDVLRDMQEQIQRRISLGQSFIRSIRAELDSNVRSV